MDKILVSIYVVSLDEFQNTITELSSGNYIKHNGAMLLNSEGNLLNVNNPVRLSGLTNGCQIMLV